MRINNLFHDPSILHYSILFTILYILLLNIYIFETRKAWNVWFWKKSNSVSKVELLISQNIFWCSFVTEHSKHFFYLEKKLSFFSGRGGPFPPWVDASTKNNSFFTAPLGRMGDLGLLCHYYKFLKGKVFEGEAPTNWKINNFFKYDSCVIFYEQLWVIIS